MKVLLAALCSSLMATAPPAEAPAAKVTSELGTRVAFHGWSPDSKYVAYTRTKTTRATRAGKPPKVQVREAHKRVKKGKLAGGAPKFGGDLAAYAATNGYVEEALERSTLDDRRTWFIAPEGVYEVRIVVADKLYWELRFEDEPLVKRAFDTVYVAVEPSLSVSPDRRHVLVVMHLDSGWQVDAAVYPVALPETVRLRREALEAGVTP